MFRAFIFDSAVPCVRTLGRGFLKGSLPLEKRWASQSGTRGALPPRSHPGTSACAGNHQKYPTKPSSLSHLARPGLFFL